MGKVVRKGGAGGLHGGQPGDHKGRAGWLQSEVCHILCTHKVNLASLSEVIEHSPSASIDYIDTKEQAADVFTKALEPLKWPNALKLLGMFKKSVLRFVNPG